jgi:Ca2+-binding RTX toxin-like protein
MYGGAGRDDLWGDGGDDTLHGDEGDDFLNGLDGDDVMYGGAGSDDLEGGGSGNDFLSGGEDDDELEGYDGADVLEGGAGDDTFKFSLAQFNPHSPLATADLVLDFEGAGAAGGDEINLSGAEHLVFRGEVSVSPTAGAALSGAGNGLTDLFYTAHAGDTWLLADDNDNGVLDATDFAVRFVGTHAFTEADFSARTDFVIAGTESGETLSGTEDGDVVFALGGDDAVFGLGGDDELHGGDGNDQLDSGTGFDVLHGEAGDDTLDLSDSDFGSGYGGSGDDRILGSNGFGSDLNGGAGNDELYAGTAGASLNGDDGDDLLADGIGSDQFTGGAGLDRFVFGAQWSSSTFSGDIIWDFEDDVEKIDLRGTGLTFEDLTIENISPNSFFSFAKISNADAGLIEVRTTFDENFMAHVHVDASDFLFDA